MEPATTRRPWMTVVWVLALAGAALLAYANSVSAPFVFDDQLHIVDNPNIRTIFPLGRTLTPPPGASRRPLVHLSLAERAGGQHGVEDLAGVGSENAVIRRSRGNVRGGTGSLCASVAGCRVGRGSCGTSFATALTPTLSQWEREMTL